MGGPPRGPNGPFPPVHGGPYMDPWPSQDPPQFARPTHAVVPFQAGGGLAPPAGATPIYTVDFATVLNGSKKFAVGTTSTKIVDASSTFRNFLSFRNTSATAIIFIDFGADASTLSTFRLAVNEILLFDARVPQDDIYVIGDVAGSVSVSWGVISLPVG